MSRKPQQERTDREQTKFWVRVVCIVLVVLLVVSLALRPRGRRRGGKRRYRGRKR